LNRNRLIAGFVLLSAFGIIILVGISLFFLALQKGRQSELNQKTPVSNLNYCNADNAKPCIVSFGFDSDGNMLVNLLIPPFYPEFHLKIVQKQSETRYECQTVENFPASFYCVGPKMPPGELLHFIIVANKDDTSLAEGDLSIIGLVFPTLGSVSSTTNPLETRIPLPFETPNQNPPTLTQTSPKPSSTPTRSAPGPSPTSSSSYPNPSSYP